MSCSPAVCVFSCLEFTCLSKNWGRDAVSSPQVEGGVALRILTTNSSSSGWKLRQASSRFLDSIWSVQSQAPGDLIFLPHTAAARLHVLVVTRDGSWLIWYIFLLPVLPAGGVHHPSERTR